MEDIKLSLMVIRQHFLLFVIVAFTFLSAPLRVYFPTSAILEIIMLGLLFYQKKGVNEKRLISSNVLLVITFYFLYFFATVLFTYKDDGSGFVNENYRFLVFLLLIYILGNSKIDIVILTKFCLWCCRIHIFFTLFELVYLAILSPGDFYSVPLVGKAMPEIEETSGYLLENDNLLSVGYRPFGLMLQPQKTGFVFVLGAVLEYVLALADKKKPSLIWNILFVTISVLQGAKTAFLVLFAIEAAIFLNFYPSKKMTKSTIAFYTICAIVLVYIGVKDIALTNIGNDTNLLIYNEAKAFFRLPISNILLGNGVPNMKEILILGGAGESFFMRILYNFGLPLTVFLLGFMAKYYLNHSRKSNYIIVLLFFGMVYHYCVINVYFIDLAFAACICLALKLTK